MGSNGVWIGCPLYQHYSLSSKYNVSFLPLCQSNVTPSHRPITSFNIFPLNLWGLNHATSLPFIFLFKYYTFIPIDIFVIIKKKHVGWLCNIYIYIWVGPMISLLGWSERSIQIWPKRPNTWANPIIRMVIHI